MKASNAELFRRFVYGLLAAYIALSLVALATRQAQATDADHAQVNIVNGIKFGWFPSQVTEKCPDLVKWQGSETFYSSKECALDFTRNKARAAGRAMSFKFEGDPKELTHVEFYEYHSKKTIHARRRSHFLRKYKKKYGEPREKYCGFQHGESEVKCVEYFWDVGKTELMLHIAAEPEGIFYGIYFVWSKKRS